MNGISLCPQCRGLVTPPLGYDRGAQFRCPLCQSVHALGEFLDQAPPPLIPVGTEATPASSVTGTSATHTTTGASAHAGAGISEPPRIERTSSSTSRRPNRSAFGELVKIVVGGAAGLVLGYWFLLWIGGPQRDFLQVGHRLPAWMVPASFKILLPPLEEEESTVMSEAAPTP